MRKDQVLTIEKFQDGEEGKFLISSSREIQLTLQAIAKNNTPVILYYQNEEQLLKSLLLCVTADGIWLDVSQNEAENNAFLHSETVTLVTLHQGAKVQFTCHQPIIAPYAGNPAYYFNLPEQIIRLQRRDYFRITTTGDAPLTCIIPLKDDAERRDIEYPVFDISVGGIGLVCKHGGLMEGEIYPDCRISLPGAGIMSFTLHIKNLYDVVKPDGKIRKQAGCEFMQLDSKMGMVLQRYIGIMQSKNISK